MSSKGFKNKLALKACVKLIWFKTRTNSQFLNWLTSKTKVLSNSNVLILKIPWLNQNLLNFTEFITLTSISI